MVIRLPSSNDESIRISLIHLSIYALASGHSKAQINYNVKSVTIHPVMKGEKIRQRLTIRKIQHMGGGFSVFLLNQF